MLKPLNLMRALVKQVSNGNNFEKNQNRVFRITEDGDQFIGKFNTLEDAMDFVENQTDSEEFEYVIR